MRVIGENVSVDKNELGVNGMEEGRREKGEGRREGKGEKGNVTYDPSDTFGDDVD